MNPVNALLGYGVQSGNYKPFLSGGKTPAPSYASVQSRTPAAPAAPGIDPNIKAMQDYVTSQQSIINQNAQLLKSLQAQLAAQPHIYSYDVTGNYAKAQQAAASTQNPYYQSMLQKMTDQRNTDISRANQDATTTQQRIDQQLADALASSGVSRTRASEDTSTKLGDIATSQGNYLQDSGTAFDQAYSALLGSQGQAGDTGLGRQAVAQATTGRATQDRRQLDAFAENKQQANLALTRTFEDLTRADTQANRQATQGKQDTQVNLDRAIQDAGTAFDTSTTSLEKEHQAALAQETQTQYQMGVNQFIQSLIGKASAADIQATRAALGA